VGVRGGDLDRHPAASSSPSARCRVLTRGAEVEARSRESNRRSFARRQWSRQTCASSSRIETGTAQQGLRPRLIRRGLSGLVRAETFGLARDSSYRKYATWCVRQASPVRSRQAVEQLRMRCTSSRSRQQRSTAPRGSCGPSGAEPTIPEMRRDIDIHGRGGRADPALRADALLVGEARR